MAHRWEVRKNKAGEYVAYFVYGKEVIWWTEGYTSKTSALNAIQSVIKNAPSAPANDLTIPADDLERFKTAEVPASDRVVTPAHNSAEFKDVEKAFKKLSDRLNLANDHQQFSDEELEVAKRETADLGREVRQSSFRPAHLWAKAKSSLLWIAEKAADGIVKALAVALLAAIASLLGIPIPTP